MGVEIGNDSMKLHPEGSEDPTCIQGLLHLWSFPCCRLRVQKSFEQERLFFRKSFGVRGLYIGSSADDRSEGGWYRSKASSLLAKPPRNAPGNGAVLPRGIEVTGSPWWALRISWDIQSPLRICWELVGLSPQVLYNHWCYTCWRAAAGSRGSSSAKPMRCTWGPDKATSSHNPDTLNVILVVCSACLEFIES